MNSMRHGFRAQEKSFSLVFHDWFLAIYVATLFIAFWIINYFWSDVMLFSEKSYFLCSFFNRSALLFLNVPLIYRTFEITTAKNVRSLFSLHNLINIILVIEIGVVLNYYAAVGIEAVNLNPGYKTNIALVVEFLWTALTFYALPIVCLKKINLVKAYIASIKILLRTYMSVVGLLIGIYLTAIIIKFMGMPFLMLFPFFKISPAIPLATEAVTDSLIAVVMLLISIGKTILYLDYTKELPAHYLEKKR